MRIALVILALVLTGCTTSQPRDVNNICSIFREKKGWYDDAVDSRKEWGSPIPVMMAIMHQESRFKATAKPPRTKFLGLIPLLRPSNSYGYSQALESTWRAYQLSAGRSGADRDDYGDSIDFIGWYNQQSHTRNGIARGDTYRLYLAYHEGQGGYGRGSYRAKQWLLNVASKVQRRADSYESQLVGCEASLKRRGWFSRWF